MGKGGRCVRLTTLPPSCAVVMKSENLNSLEPSGPLQACNGTDLPLPLQYIIYRQYTTHQYSDIMYAIGYTVATCFDRKPSSSGQ